jgi:NAD(P)H-nitrite reductase large subunit
MHPLEFYDEQRIEVLSSTQVLRVEPARHTISAFDGRLFHYGKLLIATGASPQRLRLPGSALSVIHFIHDIADAAALRAAASRVRRAVVLGAGFVGVEVAASPRALGLEVTLVERAECVMPQLHAPALSAWK